MASYAGVRQFADHTQASYGPKKGKPLYMHYVTDNKPLSLKKACDQNGTYGVCWLPTSRAD